MIYGCKFNAQSEVNIHTLLASLLIHRVYYIVRLAIPRHSKIFIDMQLLLLLQRQWRCCKNVAGEQTAVQQYQVL